MWNVTSMNQGKLEVVKQEMPGVNIDILGISELKWTGMGEFNSDDHYIYLTTSRGEFFCVLLTLSLQLYLCNLQPPRVLDISTFIIPFLR